MIEFIITFLVCTVSGFLTGLLGIGGGLIIIPFFMSILPILGSNSFSVQQIVAISTTCVCINSAVTIFYRRKEHFLPANFLLKLALAIMLGTILGSYIISFAPTKLIFAVYVGVCSLSLYLFKKEIFFNLKNSKLFFLLYFAFAFIGIISASIGIGGAILFLTVLKCFIETDTKALLPSVTLLVFINAFFAFSSKFILGEIVLYVIPIAIFASLIGSKIGIYVSKKLSSKTLNFLMSIILVFGILRVGTKLFN